MKNKKGFFLAVLALSLLSTSACNSSISEEENQSMQSAPPIASETAPTLELSQIHEFLPVGVLVSPGNNTSLMFYNLAGELTAEVSTPGIGNADPEHIHLAGKTNADDFSIPVVYHSWDPEQSLLISGFNATDYLRASNSFLALAGAPGQSALAFAEVTIENNAPHSYLFAGNLDNLDSVVPFYDLIDEPTQMALSPVGIEAISDNPQSVWYTKTGWGIGGADLIFPITRGLYYYDLTNGDNLQYVEPDRSFQGISPDYGMAGSIAFDFEGDRSMTITDLNSNQSINFPLKATSDRGAGFAVFSHDNLHAAWLEASGSLIGEPASFQAVVRVADLTSGNVVIEIEDSVITQFMNGDPVSFIKPIGWLDNQTLLIEVRGEDWGDVYLMRLHLNDRTLSYFCEGNFAGFAYP